jgi:two-component system sensor histidine kinase UhpB
VSAHLHSTRRADPIDTTTARRHSASVSILWRVFTVNAIVFATAVIVLILSPATIHTHIRRTELGVLILGLSVTLVVDLVLLALVLAPLRKLSTVMGAVDPMHPGQRAPIVSWASSEVSALAGAFNTMLDRMETERRDSARRALAAQEAERLRIALELHDEVGQTLTAVALQAERASGDETYRAQALREITQVVHASLDDLRRIARELRPEALDDLGLVDAVISLCLRIERQGTVKVVREISGGLPPLTSEVELVIYRVAQEALTNTLRHSRAAQVCVALKRDDRGGVVLSVRDDGDGLSDPPGDAGGVAGMRERALLIGASFEIVSSPGAGVEVRLTVAPSSESAA